MAFPYSQGKMSPLVNDYGSEISAHFIAVDTAPSGTTSTNLFSVNRVSSVLAAWHRNKLPDILYQPQPHLCPLLRSAIGR
jgi:hypothetical protein